MCLNFLKFEAAVLSHRKFLIFMSKILLTLSSLHIVPNLKLLHYHTPTIRYVPRTLERLLETTALVYNVNVASLSANNRSSNELDDVFVR